MIMLTNGGSLPRSCRWDVAQQFHQSMVIEPLNPMERSQFDSIVGFPRDPVVNQLCLVKTVDPFCQIDVVGIAFAANRGFDPCLSLTLGIANVVVLGSTIRAVNERIKCSQSFSSILACRPS